MKPSYEELEQKLAVSQREFRAADATIENLQMQLNAEREAKLALAAENAGLKDEISNITFMRDDDFFGSTQRAQEVMGRLVNVKTPATDSFLAEVRAQESSPLVRALTVIANSEQHDGETVVCDFDTLISVAAGALRDHYAAQLRKGVQS
ncbi:hypothetical protein [Enterobacter kobei]|uniref:hypothetical protein n=1 Tax=Enterobacter kobei TaxID=208224 RepID=UPI002074C89C|nr:hypothetical protein [Enterobacter kobei]MCM7139899.1 hypothetical protein [Enterobacter kobei]